MTFPEVFRGQRFAVVGLGRNGLAAARALQAMGADVTAWDDSAAAREAAGLPVAMPDVARADALILSPGIPHHLPAPHPLAAAAAAAGVPILCDVEMLYRAVRAAGSQARFVGITGTNGKSTTTALLAHLLRGAGVVVAEGANLGPPALTLPLLTHDDVYVLEMSSYMLERIAQLRFAAAAMLNLSPDHLDRHGDMAGYAAAKLRIFDNQTADDVAVVGVDDAPSRAMAESLARRASSRVITVSMNDGLPVLPPTLPGVHNRQNVAAALAMAETILPPTFPVTRLHEVLGDFAGLPHRQERMAEIGGVVWINDSKATNADAAARALACYPRIVWILGGIAKAGGIESLQAFFPRIAHALLIGRDAAALAETLSRHGVAHTVTGTLERAVPVAARLARPGEVVLLSPACASFDQFSGFEARGEAFRALVGDRRDAA